MKNILRETTETEQQLGMISGIRNYQIRLEEQMATFGNEYNKIDVLELMDYAVTDNITDYLISYRRNELTDLTITLNKLNLKYQIDGVAQVIYINKDKNGVK